ncbi:GNAT family N-acetyltransferase [Erysipelothrix sp. strain 2 (EsS2-6-Brazil)]|uniref:GNAT family N-acetyltransferase n=1 Tax=Erysipelothrix sp. strain 2 (EsS2-6-Brazil) TaxID=2500549 RepID=UPI0013765710|nr:GNAT family N-acetyltransferase [Erysipelothrix sp. strain 2 (EsS2-6-Brazil)]MBK2402847.1 N-acetyltransferase [Erysipelothrix sp. strain 2 (EsS2-6-Brazil)]NBA02070.1 GNAT family N-acetyltransferase [Erysipelothrix rhusiopathiae]
MKLKTHKCIIRPFCREDFNYAKTWLNDSTVMQFIEPVMDDETIKAFLKTYCLIENPPLFAIEDRETQEAIGHVIFHQLESEDVGDHLKTYEMGWILRQSAQKQGIGREVSEALIEYGFRTLALKRIVAYAIPHNTPAIHLLTDLGFTVKMQDQDLIEFELVYH